MQIQSKGGEILMVINDNGRFIRCVDINRQVYTIMASKFLVRHSHGKPYYLFSGNPEDINYDTNISPEDINIHQELVELNHH